MDRRLSDLAAVLRAAESTPLQRKLPPADFKNLLARLLPLCTRYGITRLGDLTGLDRIGLPVIQAIRPAALSEVTGLGRGTTREEAAVGAVMESLERFFSETISPDRLFLASAHELDIPAGLFEDHVRPECRDGWRDVSIPWIDALDVSSGLPHPVPFELVHTCYTDPPPAGDGIFHRTTAGLACHTSATQAFLHGLLECIERDAIARAFITHGFFERMRLPSSKALGMESQWLLECAGRGGLSIALWYAPSPTGVPVVWCQAIEAGSYEPILALPTEGHAAGADLSKAARTALLEALATRAAAISGAREDQTRRHYRAVDDPLAVQARELVTAETASDGIDAIQPFCAADVGSLVKAANAAGLGPVLAVPVGSDEENGIHCIRTILPASHSFAVVR